MSGTFHYYLSFITSIQKNYPAEILEFQKQFLATLIIEVEVLK